MKQNLLILSLLFSSIVFSQIPSYYNDVNLSQSGTALKDDLATKIISTHTNFLSYTPGVWNALEQSDLDPNNANNVLLIYGYSDTDNVEKTDRTRGKFDHGSGIGIWNREHVYPKSLGTPNLGTSGPGSDAHHLRACDGQMNSTRNNRQFAAGSGNAGITAQSDFYPGDEWKGDVARMILYMYLRYDNRCLPSNVGVGTAMASDANMIDLFLQWNVDDPVNGFEDNRNTIIAGEQGNRNPFIDNPAFATQIWGGPQAEDRFGSTTTDTQAPSIPTNLAANNTTSTTTVLSWSAATDNIGVTAYNVYQNGNLITSVSTTQYNVLNLAASTNYSFTVSAADQAGNLSNNSTAVAVTTTTNGSGGTASELFISEYIEGSSYNKAIEVANFTGNAIDLSDYTLKKQTNGAGSWNTGHTLTGTLTNGNVYVVANSNASTTVTSSANVITGNTAVTFNGNDAVGLFKNNVLIDIVGVFNGGSSNFAKDKTLIRLATVLSPNSSYTISEWTELAQDSFDDLGSHTVNGGTVIDTTAPSSPTSIVAANTTQTTTNLSWSASTDNVAVTAYDVYKNNVLLATVTNTNYAVSSLTAATTYSFSIKAKDGAGNSSEFSTAITATTTTATLSYCSSEGSNASYEYIDYVGIGGLSNTTTANNGYGDFTNQTGTLSYGSNTIVLSVGFSGSTYTEFWKVWIDFNQNGSFEASEEVVTGSTSSTSNLSYNFSVPTTALLGNTRMRVSMKWDATQTACETFSYGEVEDYTVNIGGSAKLSPGTFVKIDGELGKETAVYKANIFNTHFSLGIKMKDGRIVNYTIYNLAGELVTHGVFKNKLNLSALETGVYMVNLDDGQRVIQKKVIKK